MTTITLTDSTGFLTAPPVYDHFGRVVEDAKGNCGFILRSIDWIINWVTGTSLLEKIFSFFAGDFNGVARAAGAWEGVGKSLDHSGQNYFTMASGVPSTWIADEATRAADRMRELGQAHLNQAEAAGLMSRQIGNMLECTASVIEAIGMGLALIEEVIISLTVAKIAKEIATMGSGVRTIINTVRHVLELIQSLHKIIPPLLQFLSIFNTVLAGCNLALKGGVAIGQGSAGAMIDDVAAAGFGGSP